MPNIFYYIATVILLYTMSFDVMAGDDRDLQKLMSGKAVVYKGMCNFREDGTFTFKNDEAKYHIPCLVGMDLPDETKHYLVLLDRSGRAVRVILFDETTKTQTSVWFSGTEV